MNFKTIKEDNKVTILIEGSIDTTSSGETFEYVKKEMNDANELILDLSGVDYVSSAGLRIFLIAHKDMLAKKGKFALTKVSDDIKSIFDLTGLTGMLTII